MSRNPATSPLPLLIPTLGLAALAPPAVAQSVVTEATEEPLVFEAPDGSFSVTLREKTLGWVDPSMDLNSVRLGPDGTSMAYMTVDGGDVYVVRDGVQGQAFDAVAIESIVYSPDGSRLAYGGIRDEEPFIVIDDVAYPSDPPAFDGIVFSEDGNRFGWVSSGGRRSFIAHVDGQAQKEYRSIEAPGLVFAPYGAHYAYIAQQDGAQCVVLDGVEGPWVKNILAMEFTTDGGHLIALGREKERFILMVDGELIGDYGAVGMDGFAFPNVGDSWAIAVRRAKRWHVLVDGEEKGDYNNVFGVTMSADASRMAFIAGQGEGMFLVVDWEEIHTYDKYKSLGFSPDGKHVAYAAVQGERMLAVVDGVPGPDFKTIPDPGVRFSDDGSRHAYVATRDKKTFVVVDGEIDRQIRKLDDYGIRFTPGGNKLVYMHRSKAGRSVVVEGHESGPWNEVWGPVSSADGLRTAYAGRDGKKGWTVVLDGKTWGPYPYLAEPGPVFSPDGQRTAWVVGRNRRSFYITDGKKGPEFDLVAPGTLTFTSDSKHVVCAGAVADKRYLVVDDLLIENGYEGFLQGSEFIPDAEGNLTLRTTRGAS